MRDRGETTSGPGGPAPTGLGMVLTGGGARAAYQVGLLRYLARRFPDLRFPILTGVSAGAINAVYLAAHPGNLQQAVDGLTKLWSTLETENVFRVDVGSLGKNLIRWGTRLVSGGSSLAPQVHGLVDSSPLAELLTRAFDAPRGVVSGISTNLERGDLGAVALTTLDYSTGGTVTWVQGCDIHGWERPSRSSRKTWITVDHVMASASLPLLFPAIRLAGSWHGDGGVRLSAPLSPALHLGATRLLVVSTRYQQSEEEAERPTIAGYPPPAQIMGHLLDAIFLDVIDQDVLRVERLTRLVERLPPQERLSLKPVRVLALRPSQDLAALAAEYEPRLPGAFRFLTRSLGTRETESPDFLSLLMFQPDYLTRLIEIGERDAEEQADEVMRLLEEETEADRASTGAGRALVTPG